MSEQQAAQAKHLAALKAAEIELTFCQRAHVHFRITERLTRATMRVQDAKAALAALAA
jgi:hypothetical protein